MLPAARHVPDTILSLSLYPMSDLYNTSGGRHYSSHFTEGAVEA